MDGWDGKEQCLALRMQYVHVEQKEMNAREIWNLKSVKLSSKIAPPPPKRFSVSPSGARRNGDGFYTKILYTPAGILTLVYSV